MRKKGLVGAFAVACMLALSACGGPANSGPSTADAIMEKYPAKVENEGTPVKDAMLKVAYVSDSPFKGIFNPYFYTEGDDNAFMENTMAGAFPTDAEFRLILDSDKTPINMHVDEEKKVVTYKINPKFKWNDGTPVTTADIVKTYEILANPKYIAAAQSPRFGSDMHIIKGIVEYNEGKADHISGLEVISPSEMKIHLTKMTPGVYYGGPFAGEFVQAKSLEGVPMDKIQSSDAFCKNPPSYGPYYITKILSGQSVTFKANPYYYKGKPKIENVEISVLPVATQVAATKSGKFDIIMSPAKSVFDQMTELNNINILSRPALYMSYMGFNQGKWNEKTNSCEFDPKAKMSDTNLKKALAYAIDNDKLSEKFSHGLSFTAEGPIAPVFKSLQNPEVKGYHIDLDKSKKLLDEGGYKDVDGDGYREGKDGKPMTIHLAMMSGGPNAEPISQYYLQQWKEIGIKADLVDGRLLEFHNFYEMVQNNDPKIDVFMAAFRLASDPNPTGLWGPKEAFNLGRYTNPKLTEALDKINSEEACDPKKNEEFFHNFEKVFFEECPGAPMQNTMDLLVINKRVKSYDWNYGTNFDWSKLELTAENPKAAN